MKEIITAAIAAALFANTGFSQAPNHVDSASTSTLLQVQRLAGDQFGGFRQTCLLVYADGRFHREDRQQIHAEDPRSGDWQLPNVFAGRVSTEDLRRLNEIIEMDGFRAVTGTVGDPHIFPNLLIWRHVMPHTNIDIFEASILHPNGSQLFSLIGVTAQRQLDNSLKLFTEWVTAVEKRKEGRLDPSLSNGCAISPSPGKGGSWKTTTRSARPLTSNAGADLGPKNTKHAGTIVLEVIVNADGSVGSIAIKQGIDYERDQLALDAIRKWKFSPALLQGIAIPMPVEVEVQMHWY